MVAANRRVCVLLVAIVWRACAIKVGTLVATHSRACAYDVSTCVTSVATTFVTSMRHGEDIVVTTHRRACVMMVTIYVASMRHRDRYLGYNT